LHGLRTRFFGKKQVCAACRRVFSAKNRFTGLAVVFFSRKTDWHGFQTRFSAEK
jgi:hypothetical protein